MRSNTEEYNELDLRAHSLLAGADLHDVWIVDLPDGGAGRTISDIRSILSRGDPGSSNVAVRLLFALRGFLGRIFGWDQKPGSALEESFLKRLSEADHKSSLVAPGTAEGIFQVLFVSPRESISEIRNATVHAFSVLALAERPSGYRLYLSIYVRPVGRITSWYMRLIDPLRRTIIYPAILRQIRAGWEESFPEASPD